MVMTTWPGKSIAALSARVKELEGEDTPFEAVHAEIRDGVLRAAEEIRARDDVKSAHQIMAGAAQRAAGRLNSELNVLTERNAKLVEVIKEGLALDEYPERWCYILQRFEAVLQEVTAAPSEPPPQK